MKKEDFEKVIKEKQKLLDKLTNLINIGIKIERNVDIQYRVLEDIRCGGYILKDFRCIKDKLIIVFENTWGIEESYLPFNALENEETFKKWVIETNNKLKMLAERERLLKLKEQKLQEEEKEQQEKELYLKLKEKYEGKE